MIWATNQYEDISEGKVFGWDGQDYSHLLLTTNLKQVQSAPIPDKYVDVNDSIKSKRKIIASSYELADKSLLVRNVKLKHAKIQETDLNKKIGMPIIGIENNEYNTAHLSYAPYTQKAYFTVNDLGKIKPGGTRRLQIMEAEFKDGSLTNKHLLQLGDTSFSVMHPAIHPKGNILVYCSNQGNMNGDYDLYYTVLENKVWSSPLPLTQINTKGNEVFQDLTMTVFYILVPMVERDLVD